MTRAQAMFEGIVKNAPYSKFAPLAQFNVGQTLEKQGEYPRAIEAYQLCVNKYPSDAIADTALYQVGYVRMRETREGSYDRASVAKARESFEDFIARYPNSEKVPQARENLKSLEEELAGLQKVLKEPDPSQLESFLTEYSRRALNQMGGKS